MEYYEGVRYASVSPRVDAIVAEFDSAQALYNADRLFGEIRDYLTAQGTPITSIDAHYYYPSLAMRYLANCVRFGFDTTSIELTAEYLWYTYRFDTDTDNSSLLVWQAMRLVAVIAVATLRYSPNRYLTQSMPYPTID